MIRDDEGSSFADFDKVLVKYEYKGKIYETKGDVKWTVDDDGVKPIIEIGYQDVKWRERTKSEEVKILKVVRI